MERKTRFELATSSLARRHSTAELLPLFQTSQAFFPCGAENQSRTGDTRIFSPLLYHLSYLGPEANLPKVGVKLALFF